MDDKAKQIRLPKKAEKVKNKAPAPVQITAEQLLREAKERELEVWGLGQAKLTVLLPAIGSPAASKSANHGPGRVGRVSPEATQGVRGQHSQEQDADCQLGEVRQG
jgi:hypothetical protein